MIDDPYTNPDALRKRFQPSYTAFNELDSLIGQSNIVSSDTALIVPEINPNPIIPDVPVEIRFPELEGEIEF